MPTRSLNSAVHKWPDRETVLAAAQAWVKGLVRQHPEIVRIGIIGSYARGDCGVGSDLDLLVEVSTSDQRFGNRLADLDTHSVPVPTEILVYTTQELDRMRADSRRFIKEVDRDAIWLHGTPGSMQGTQP